MLFEYILHLFIKFMLFEYILPLFIKFMLGFPREGNVSRIENVFLFVVCGFFSPMIHRFNLFSHLFSHLFSFPLLSLLLEFLTILLQCFIFTICANRFFLGIVSTVFNIYCTKDHCRCQILFGLRNKTCMIFLYKSLSSIEILHNSSGWPKPWKTQKTWKHAFSKVLCEITLNTRKIYRTVE